MFPTNEDDDCSYGDHADSVALGIPSRDLIHRPGQCLLPRMLSRSFEPLETDEAEEAEEDYPSLLPVPAKYWI